MLSKVVSSSIFKVFGMTRPGIEPRSPGPLANTLTDGPGDALSSKEKDKDNEDIKEIEKWVLHSSANPKANRNGFVVSRGILILFKPVNRLLSIYIYFFYGRFWWCKGKQAWLANLHEWVRFSLGVQFIRPCATSKQRAL